MAHPFNDKLIVFIGTPQRCSRMKARDALTAVGGVPDDRLAAFTDFVAAFPGAEGTKVYAQAAEYAEHGALSVLTEDQFFDILAGQAAPPERLKRKGRVIITPALDAEAEKKWHEETRQTILNQRRMKNLARYGVPTESGRVKADLRKLDLMNRVMKKLEENDSEND